MKTSRLSASLLALGAAFALGSAAIAQTAPAKPAPAAKAAPAKPAPAKPAVPFEAARVELVGAARTQALALASAALNDASSVQGRFLQIAPGGASSQGSFYLQRPGKLRFEYDSPQTLTIVSDGGQLSVMDRALKTDERYPLRATPLYFVLKKNIALDTDGKVTKVISQGDQLQITLRDKTGQADGSITLMFDKPSRELRQWRIVDGQGSVTQLVLTQTRAVAGLDSKLFYLKPATNPAVRRP